MLNKMKSLTISLGLLQLVACAGLNEYHPYARNVSKKPGEKGVVALNVEHRKEDQDKAMSMMKETCQDKKVTVVEEGEVSVGTITEGTKTQNTSKPKEGFSMFGIPLTPGGQESTENLSSVTTQKKEWQINYKCTL